MTPKSKTALFPGSFRPFTIGHASIAERTLAIADKLVIGVGYNINKDSADAGACADAIRKLYADDPRVEVILYSGLTTDLAHRVGADFIVRGVRGTADYEYERNLAETNLAIGGVETLLMPALPELGYISSSMVRELQAHGADTTRFLPVKK